MRRRPRRPQVTGGAALAGPTLAAAAARRRGDYREVVRIAEAAVASGTPDFALVLECVRAQIADGRPLDAASTLRRHGGSASTPAARTLAALYGAWLVMLQTGDPVAMIRRVDAAVAGLSPAGLDPADAAEIRSVEARFRLGAAKQHVAGASPPLPADRLAALADELLALGRRDAGIETMLVWAEEQPKEAYAAAIDHVRDQAIAHGRPDLAATALVARAQARLPTPFDPMIGQDLALAGTLFGKAGHRLGPIDVRCAAARLEIERDAAPLDRLEAVIADYRALDHPKGELHALLSLSTYAHERGDLKTVKRAQRELTARVEEVGMGMLAYSNAMSEVDQLMRASDNAAARDICDEVLATGPPPLLGASFQQLRGAALGFAGDRAGALASARSALAQFVAIGAESQASTAAMKLAADLVAAPDDARSAEASGLLADWIERDEARGDAEGAASKRELEIDLKINGYRRCAEGRGDPALLAEAERLIAAAQSYVEARLAGPEAAQRLAGLEQRRATLASLRGDEPGMDAALRRARDIAAKAGFAMEAANSSYLLGCLLLNRANRDPDRHFAEAESALNDALAYYAAAGMRQWVAGARDKMAMLYENAMIRASDESAAALHDAALAQLGEGIEEIEEVRRAFWAPSLLAAREGKRAIGAEARPLIERAIRLNLGRGRFAEVWAWTQRLKARALNDLLGGHVELRPAVLASLEEQPALRDLVREEAQVEQKLSKASPLDIPKLRSRLRSVRSRMRAEPALADYVEQRLGDAPDLADIRQTLRDIARPAALAEWFALGDRLFLALVRKEAEPVIVPLSLGLGEVTRFVAGSLSAETYRATLRDAPELLDALAPLVAELGRRTDPGEALILCPTEALFAVPLHALPVDGAPLIARNPIGYAPSLGVLRACMARAGRDRAGAAAVFGDTWRDRDSAAVLATLVADSLGTQAVLGDEVTREAVIGALAEADILHFQGHARHDPVDALRSRLLLAGDQALLAGDLLAMRIHSRTIVLGACESAAHHTDPGDEILGLIPAFLLAGATRVVAAQWRVYEGAAAAFMEEFYARARTLALIDAVRESALAVRARPDFASPLFWAPFMLYGAGWEAL